ncbi:MAG: CYTH domain-containing protein [Clostridia bacterium]|nr:CYTH domain-containing protein [Clostridia bacterium]
MKSEYEVRVLDIDSEKFINEIESLGATFVNKYEQKRYIYDFNPKIDNKWIRLRTDGLKTTLAIKEYQSSEVGGTKEIEIEVSDLEDTNEILNELGYFKRSVQENRRIRYMLNDVEIDIDTWPHLNTYVEFEGKSKEAVFEILKVLNIDEKDVTTMDAQDIYLANGYTLEDMNDLRFD